MDSQVVALVIAAGGLLLGVARLALSVLSYRLDSQLADRLNDDDDTATDPELRDAA